MPLFVVVANGYNSTICNNLVNGYCCGDGLLSNDTACLQFAGNCAAKCPNFIPANSPCDPALFGVWETQLPSTVFAISATSAFYTSSQTPPLSFGVPRCNVNTTYFAFLFKNIFTMTLNEIPLPPRY